MVIFEWGLEADPGFWIYLDRGEADDLQVLFDPYFLRKYEKAN